MYIIRAPSRQRNVFAYTQRVCVGTCANARGGANRERILMNRSKKRETEIIFLMVYIYYAAIPAARTRALDNAYARHANRSRRTMAPCRERVLCTLCLVRMVRVCVCVGEPYGDRHLHLSRSYMPPLSPPPRPRFFPLSLSRLARLKRNVLCFMLHSSRVIL